MLDRSEGSVLAMGAVQAVFVIIAVVLWVVAGFTPREWPNLFYLGAAAALLAWGLPLIAAHAH